MIKEKTQISNNPDADSTSKYQLILFNDDFNTFDYVVETLVDICNHEPLQAEQCAWIAHYRGKCTVKQGDKTVLKPMYNSINKRGLIAEIQ